MTDIPRLADITTEELFGELAARFDSLVLITERVAKTDRKTRVYDVQFRNGWATAIGLCHYAAHKILTGEDKNDAKET